MSTTTSPPEADKLTFVNLTKVALLTTVVDAGVSEAKVTVKVPVEVVSSAGAGVPGPAMNIPRNLLSQTCCQPFPGSQPQAHMNPGRY